MSPTAELADIVLPVTSAVRGRGAAGRVRDQPGRPVARSAAHARSARPRGEARSDLQIIFALAQPARAGRAVLRTATSTPHGATSSLRAASPSSSCARSPRASGCRCTTRKHRKYASTARFPHAVGQGRAVLAEAFADRGYPPIPTFAEPPHQPALTAGPGGRVPARPDLRQVAVVLRVPAPPGRQPAPRRHPTRRSRCTPRPPPPAGSRRATGCGSSTPNGSVRARAKLNANLDPSVVVRPARLVAGVRRARAARLPALTAPDSANLNLVLDQRPSDPVSGSSPLRASLCDVERAE